MRSKIRVLSEKDINQIAAGEVIEDPASVVKELVENAIDANAEKITVAIEAGGLKSIVVRDDGEGMSEDDAALCLERHATSKISSASDIAKLHSMGFRGEALPAIASVSKFEIKSSKEDSTGTRVLCHGGKMIDISPCGHPKGTTISVSSLFYNTPARKKFQKSATQLTKNINKMMTKLALAHPTVRFTLTSNGKEVLTTSKRESKRLTEVLGDLFTKDCNEIDFSKNGISIKGFVGTPNNVRSNRMGQYLFVNHRAVYSLLVSNAVQSALSTMISKGEHPTFILWCEFQPEAIDVNVHPQKKELRFYQEEVVFATIREAVELAMGGFAIPETLFKSPQAPIWQANEAQGFKWQASDTTARYTPKIDHKKESPEPLQETPHREELFIERDFDVIGLRGSYLCIEPSPSHPFLQGQQASLLLVDLAKVESLLAYERMIGAMHQKVATQARLIPESLEFYPEESSVIREHLKEFVSLGIILQPFGKNTFLLDALSEDLETSDPRGLVSHVAGALSKKSPMEEIVKTLLGFRSVKRTYSVEEARCLLEKLLTVKNPFRTPSGDKTMLPLTETIMKGLFKG